MGFKVFTNGTTLTAEDLNDFLMEQTVMNFASTTERDNSLPSPVEGMMCWVRSLNQLQVYYSGWKVIPILGSTPQVPVAQAVGTFYGGPSSQAAFTTVVNFPSGRFTATPRVFINLNYGAAAGSGWIGRAISISTTQFTLFGLHPSGTVSTFSAEWQWHAVQM